MDEQFYIDLIDDLNDTKDLGGEVITIKNGKFENDKFEYGIMMPSISSIQIYINKRTLVYTDGVYNNSLTALINQEEPDGETGHYAPKWISKDLHDTINAAISEFYKYHVINKEK